MQRFSYILLTLHAPPRPHPASKRFFHGKIRARRLSYEEDASAIDPYVYMALSREKWRIISNYKGRNINIFGSEITRCTV